MKETLSLQEFLKIIRKQLGLIATVTILSITITGLVSYFVLTPIYEASTEILVNQSSDEAGELINQSVLTDLQLVNTYSGIIKSPVILDQVVDEMNLGITSNLLDEKITVSNDEESQIVKLTVLDKNPKVAVEIANTTASIFENNIQEWMNVDNVTIFSPAVLKGNPLPVSPYPMLNMGIAAVVGLMLGIGIAFFLEYLDTTIKDQKDVKDILGIPFLGNISPIVEKAEFQSLEKVAATRRGEISNG